ncbi:MAG: dienelactone hydrolase family protein [Hyphomicrobiales bacterium]|nr:dienelactone hydrolase family protein [Hyphomicrobiales bacterium]MCP5372998.1 dienelactone hydrolase family protein [Hyphomicrobiales bacterium]
MTRRLATGLVLLAALAACNATGLTEWRQGGTAGRAMVCKPEGAGPFPAVVYNHGLIVDRDGLSAASGKGYDMAGMCRALAGEGILAFFPVRASGLGHLRNHLTEVEAALEAVRARPDVDPNRVVLAGFSRGGLLTMVAAARGASARAFVIMAPAPGRGMFDRVVPRAAGIAAPVLVMVEAGDSADIRGNVDSLEAALRGGRVPHRVIRYDRGGGHKLFYGAGYWWRDYVDFLKNPG